MKKLVLIDAHAIIHRAYHALPPLTTPAGEPINAVYGFTSMLVRFVKELQPDYITACFDLPGPTFRHIAYERYKAQRPETPSDLSSQFAKVRDVLDAFGIVSFAEKGYEADDLIGTISEIVKHIKDVEVIIVTGDMDTLQLIRPNLRVYAMRKGISDIVIYDKKEVESRFGFAPHQLIDFKGLKGDPSDNIPGVKGIGEKTAVELLKQFDSIEGIYKALEKDDGKISPAVVKKLRDGTEDARFSKELATIKTDVPIEWNLEALRFRSFASRMNEIQILFQKFGFSSLLKRLDVTEEKEKNPEEARVTTETTIELLQSPAQWKKIESYTVSESALLVSGEALALVVKKTKKVFLLGRELCITPEIQKFFQNKPVSVHDAKSVIRFLRTCGTALPSINFDTMLAAYLVQPFTRDFSYTAVASRELGRLAMAGPEEYMHFFDVMESLQEKLIDEKIRSVFEDIELPLARILADMEMRGILIDKKFLEQFGKKINRELVGLTKHIYDAAGEEFNINSPKQLSHILFDVLEIQTKGLRKTAKGGVISTSASELEKLRDVHPIVAPMLNYRELMKLKTTYVDVLPDLANTKTGRIHTTYNQTGAATGRLSSSDPNLQNIPIMSEYGREVRKAFIADTGFQLVSFDYSQIELRLAAHLAQDKKMIETFQAGLDIHKMTAAEIYNVPLDHVTSDLRRAAKTLNFGVLYGMGAQAFAESTGMSRTDAKKFIDEYFHDFSGVRDYIEETKRFAEENGYVATLFGRRRYIPEILSPNWQLKREAERMAVNAPIQGSAADLVKMAMITVDAWIAKEKLGDEVKMLLQIHDELVFEIADNAIQKVVSKIRTIMEGVATLAVPLVVDVKAGQNWGEQKIYEI